MSQINLYCNPKTSVLTQLPAFDPELGASLATALFDGGNAGGQVLRRAILLDTETTGLVDDPQAEIIELAMAEILFDGGTYLRVGERLCSAGRARWLLRFP